MMISERNAEYSDSFCGYASGEWMQFGSENKVQYVNGDIDVAFCSTSFYSKNIAAGFIIPIAPINGQELQTKRWVQISNLNEKHDLKVGAPLQFCESRYPHGSCGLEGSGQKESILLKKGESGWIALPELDKYELTMKSNETIYTFTFTKSVAYSWWMVTV